MRMFTWDEVVMIAMDKPYGHSALTRLDNARDAMEAYIKETTGVDLDDVDNSYEYIEEFIGCNGESVEYLFDDDGHMYKFYC